jgi:SEC-C motif-containing protein
MARSAKQKVGRNAQCPCGSGLKYKKCCSEKDATQAPSATHAGRRRLRKLSPAEEASPVVVALRRKVEAQAKATAERLRTEFGVYINYVAPTEFQGQKVWAIGNRVYTDRPPNETFHEFLLQVLRETLGEEWRSAQDQLGGDDQHFVMRCFTEYEAWKADHLATDQSRDGVWSARPNGWARYLHSLAWDVATLIHATGGRLPESLVRRVRDRTAFQSARYEIAVAAIFARLDCEIRFLDEDEELRSEKRVELIARHRPTGQEIAVEAKSRRRAGVVNEGGDRNEDDPLHGDARGVRRLFVRALEKGVRDLPYMIFIDINAPPEPEAAAFTKGWQRAVGRMMAGFPKPTAESPDAYSALYVTNFSPQYNGTDLALPGEWLSIRPLFVETAPAFDLAGMLDYALDRYDRVPEIGLGGEILA